MDRVNALRLERQCLLTPAEGDAYDGLFRDLSPVTCEYWSRPGDPPRLFQRSLEPDFDYNNSRRPSREILKGRFQGGGIAYVSREDLELFACLYRKDAALSPDAFLILDTLEREGPLTAQQLRELTGLGKAVSPALQKLQEAFLIFEDQVDCDWDRGFYPFPGEFPDVDLARYTPPEALMMVLPQYFFRMVWANEEDLKSFFKRPAKEVHQAVIALTEQGILSTYQEGFILAEDLSLLERPAVPAPSVFALHRNDFLVKSWEHRLKGAYPHAEHQVMYYLLIDGIIGGAVLGRFSNKVNELELVVFDDPKHKKRLPEVNDAIRQVTSAPLCWEK